MPQIVEEAMEKAQALETAFSMRMDLSVYSMMPIYLQNMNGGMIPAQTNLAMYQPAYSISYSQPESVEKIVERQISEGIIAALSQMRTETKPTNPTPNNNNNNNQNRNNSGCYVCGRTGHIAKNCCQRNNQQNNNNRNNNRRDLRNVDCYNCRRKGYVSRNCKSPYQIMKNKIMYNLWQVAGGKVENRESSLQAVLRETKEEIALDIKKDECVFLFNNPAFNCDIYLTKVPDYQELQQTELKKQGVWTITSFEQFQFMVKHNELTLTLVNYCTDILNQLIREEPAYLNQKERAEEALYGEAIVYGQPINVLIDSGAVGCIISKRFLDKINKGIELPTNIKIIDVTGQKSSPLGMVQQVPVQMRDIKVHVNMIVTNSAEYNVLLVIDLVDELELEDELEDTIAVPFYKAKIIKSTFQINDRQYHPGYLEYIKQQSHNSTGIINSKGLGKCLCKTLEDQEVCNNCQIVQ
ncbi:unnamed protein product [Rhizophagus irregularis]|nr:unnamed protein product [Rhizophagus irregularis]